MAMLSKGSKPEKFEPDNQPDSLKLNCIHMWGFWSNFSFQTLVNIKHSCSKANFDDLIHSGNFYWGLSLFNSKGFCYSACMFL